MVVGRTCEKNIFFPFFDFMVLAIYKLGVDITCYKQDNSLEIAL